MFESDIEKIIFTKEEIEKKNAELGAQITKDYAGEEVVLIGILNGSVIFLSDLVRHIKLPLSFDFMSVSSYKDSSSSSGTVQIIKDVSQKIINKNIIIVEDIVDTGLTLDYLKKTLLAKQPKSLKICTLLDKKAARKIDITPDYTGFIVPNEFIVGYGLDYAQKYRNLPYIGILKPSIYK